MSSSVPKEVTGITMTDARPVSGRYRTLTDPDSVRAFLRNVGEGIYITTRDGRILDANPAFLALFGARTVDELRGLRATELIVDPARREEELARIDEEGAVREFELTVRRLDGEIRHVLDTAYVVTDPDTGESFYHGILVDITTRTQLEQHLRTLSFHDPLTGCLNRRILAQVEDAFERDPDAPWGAVFVDIDHFKRYNDDFGHQAGDDVLVHLARFLGRHVRAEESVVRFGGDEFLVLLRGADAAVTEAVAGRLRDSAATAAPVPFSLGWAARTPGESLGYLIERADQRMLAVRITDPLRVSRRTSDPRGAETMR